MLNAKHNVLFVCGICTHSTYYTLSCKTMTRVHSHSLFSFHFNHKYKVSVEARNEIVRYTMPDYADDVSRLQFWKIFLTVKQLNKIGKDDFRFSLEEF
jgi:hypothetical protein